MNRKVYKEGVRVEWDKVRFLMSDKETKLTMLKHERLINLLVEENFDLENRLVKLERIHK